jgi:hypothetical protein
MLLKDLVANVDGTIELETNGFSELLEFNDLSVSSDEDNNETHFDQWLTLFEVAEHQVEKVSIEISFKDGGLRIVDGIESLEETLDDLRHINVYD